MENKTAWTRSQKALFIYGSIFFILGMLWNLNLIPGMHSFVPWFSQQFLNTEITTFTNGSGDTTYDYVYVLLITITTLILGSLWLLIDRKKRNYDTPLYWLNLVIRYYLGYMMLTYGFVKVVQLQFLPPSLTELLKPFGDRSPMGLAWSYMGYSRGFGYVIGVAEMSVGLLLLFRNTYVFGAFIGIFVCLNIFVVNLFFDVPVKLFSGSLLLMSIFLVLPDVQRLARFFLCNKATAPKEYPKISNKHWFKLTRYGLVGLYVFALGLMVYEHNGYRKLYGDLRTLPPLYGLYDVKQVIKGGDTVPPLTTDPVRWSHLIVQYPGSAQIKLMDNKIKHVAFKVDEDKQELIMHPHGDTTAKDILAYTLDDGNLILQGQIGGEDHLIDLEERDLNTFRLISTPFRWINEYPDNQ